MSCPDFPLDWKESVRPTSFVGRIYRILSIRRRRTQQFLDPELPGPRFAFAVQPEEPSLRVLLRRALLLVVLACAGIYGGVWAERWWTEREHRQWLEASRAAVSRQATVSLQAPTTPVLSQSEAFSAPDRNDDVTDGPDAAELAATAVYTAPAWPALALGDPVGRLRIPDLGVDGFVEHGETERVLRRAIGHLPGTALPGEGGNVVVAGHRDSFFRGLRSVAQGDTIEFTTPYGTHRYEVDGLQIVGPDDAAVLAPTDDERLTLITCYPFDYVGPAPRRFIVTARPRPSS